jgi:hypothetical protein
LRRRRVRAGPDAACARASGAARRDGRGARSDARQARRATSRRKGGYFLWIKLPGVDADALAVEADKAGVPVVRGSSCYPDGRGQGRAHGSRFSAVTPEDITEGIERLRVARPLTASGEKKRRPVGPPPSLHK